MKIPLEIHLKHLANSFEKLLHKKLITYNCETTTLTDAIDSANFIVLSHGTETDPILNYGNKNALELWEMSFEHFTQTTSKKTAEAPLREEREALLQRVKEDGYIDDYQGIRITKSGKRFFIETAIVWNITDDHNNLIGQAATFSNWKFL
ncbi:MAG: MEKHLA domain-containing protein [Planctomycetota bacterium]|nr:MAG: MEKHLA domain-containing protein [Planctomycetota bacterium]